MKRFLGITTLVLAIGIGGFGCNDKKDNDDETMMTLLLFALTKQQAASSSAATEIAAHPGCSVLNTASTTSQKLTYGTIGGRYEAVIKFTLNAGQKLVITTSAGTLPTNTTSATLGDVRGANVFSENACTTGDFTSLTAPSLTFIDNTSDKTKFEISATSTSSFSIQMTITDAVTAGATITYQIQ